MIHPYNNNILIKTDLKDTRESKGGLKLATDIKFRNESNKNKGVVIEIGSTAFEEMPKDIEVGDEVHFSQHAGYQVEQDDKDAMYRLIQDVDIYAFNKKK